MGMTHKETLQKLVAAGMRLRYGDHPTKQVLLRYLWEMKHIIDAGHIDYYLMAFWIFRHYADSAGISFWARGAMPSSIVCYALMLTDIDPVKYGLNSVRFVNDELPKFQFDIEASRFNEFMNRAEEILAENAKDFDITAIKACLFKEDVKVGEKMKITYLTPCEYLSRKHERPLPESIDDELARYALYFPGTMDLYEAYIKQPSTLNGLIYQEQMLDILRQVFHVGSIKADQIRLAIQRGEAQQVEAYRQKLFSDLKDITPDEAERAWQRLTSNPRAFLKAHAVSHVMAKYKFDF